MATILVDYENVFTTDGLKGVEYLNEKDTLIVFYSQCCEKIRAEYINAIEKADADLKPINLPVPERTLWIFILRWSAGC